MNSCPPPAVDNDALLLRRYRATGDRAAYEALFRKYQGPIYALVIRLVRHAQAYDLTQDVFLRALRSLKGFRGDCSFRTWLYTIARHVCYNHNRDEQKRHSIEEPFSSSVSSDGDGSTAEADYEDFSMDVPRIAETKELQRVVAAIMEGLTPEQRLLMTLRDFEGMSYEEMCEITGLSLVNVKSKLHRARLAFKARFAPHWQAMQEDFVNS